MRLLYKHALLLQLFLCCWVTGASASDVWDEPAFAADPASLRQAAEVVKLGKDNDATILLTERTYSFDTSGRMTDVRHMIYRVETEEGVKVWSESSAVWAPWSQARPEIKARVITADGSVHWLDSKTLSDLPVNEDTPEVYSDKRKYGGPLPAVAPGVLVEEEIVLRETAPFFAAGTITARSFDWYVPVNKARVVLSFPETLPVHYSLRLLPEISVVKATVNNTETIKFEQGPLPPSTEELDHIPPDLAVIPELQFTTGTSWHEVAAEYARLIDEKIRLADVEPLMSKINIKGSTREQVIRRIVAAVHNNVRYTGVEFGESNLIPQYPSETLKRKYGDCKDKAALLATMLRSAGIPANLALLNAGPGLDINPDLPGMGVFDHAIVYVPGAGPDPELWIDATAQYSQVGFLPWGDYGRRALVISASTDSLVQTPELTSDRVVHRELREFTMAEYGPATIVETDEDVGPGDAGAREYYSGDSKEIRKQAEEYVSETYLADSLTSLEHGDLSNLEKPASVKYVAVGRRGGTYLDSATAAIRIEALFGNLPKYFKTEDKQAEKSGDEEEKPRTADWWIDPFTVEWDYKIIAPIGFKVRSLPPDSVEKISPLTLTQTYSSDSDGTIIRAVLRLENTQRRLTVEQAKQLRDAVLKARNRDAILINFDHVGHSLLASGKIREGLAAYEKVTAQHPKEALHKAQLARALLTAGLGERARQVALEGTKLEPSSFIAYKTLGQVLKNDLVGRPLKKGMDYTGAVAAYKKAIALDPKDKDTQADLALLFECDAEGIRYGENAHLKEAVEVLRNLKKLDGEYERSYEDNVLYDLWYAADYKALLDYAGTLPASEVRKGLIVAATAIQEGSEAALKKSVSVTADEQSRDKVLANASAVLVRARRYPEATEMLTEAARGGSNENQARNITILSKTKRYTDVKLDPANPGSVIIRLYGRLLSGDLKLDEFKSMLYMPPGTSTEPVDEKQFKKMMSMVKAQLASSGTPPINIADTVASNMHCTAEGDDSTGYRVTVESPGASAQEVFVVRDGGDYKIAALSTETTGSNTEDLAWLVLRDLKQNNLAGARIWLDRARDRIHASSGDDPLSGALFPHFWTKGQDADARAMHTAALVLLPSKQAGSYLGDLKEARDAAKSETDRTRLTLVMAYAYSALERWPELLTSSEELVKAEPTSVHAFNLIVIAYRQLKRFDDWQKLVEQRIQKYPDEMAYVRSAAQLALNRGEMEKSREITKTIIDKGKSNEQDLNLYAWYALFLPGPIATETLDIAHRASDLSKNNSFSILHTLACVYAQAGKTTQAREYLLKAMDAGHMEEPDPAIWLGFALIAEQYGIFDAAGTMYRRVEKTKFEVPGSNYSVAQQHLALLPIAASSSTISAKH
jgi:tetratricopeptide (TPR) repeat protein/transglutaminase-like putative cysteine protease